MREYSAIGGKEPPFPVTRRNLHCVVLYVRYPPLRAGLALVPVLGTAIQNGAICAQGLRAQRPRRSMIAPGGTTLRQPGGRADGWPWGLITWAKS